MILRVAWAVALLLVGCDVTNSIRGIRDGDADLFATQVQPILGRDCAFQGCHGREGMPLTLYAVDFLRLRDPEGDVDTARTALDETVLSEAELEHNRRGIAERTSNADPSGEGLILRLLPVDEGGIPHADVVVYARYDDADLVTLRRFLRTVRVD